MSVANRARQRTLTLLGGPGQASVVLMLAGVIGLGEAVTSTISATANNIEAAFHIGNAEFGLLATVASLVAALFMVPFGMLADRTWRTRLLAGIVALWTLAIVAAGFATSYPWLLAATAALGVMSGAAAPIVASLTGDFFPADVRGRLYGLILGGQIVGAGVGLVVAGDISAATSWRYAFWWLAVPSLALAWLVWRVPEPVRGAHSRSSAPGDGDDAGGNLAYAAARRAGAAPRPKLVLRDDPATRSTWWAIGYVLRVPTTLVIIVASSLGYFYFGGLRSFAVLFAVEHYGIGKPLATTLIAIVGLGGLVGMLVAGPVTDRALRRGDVRARVLLPALCLLIATPVLALAVASGSFLVAVPILIVGAVLLFAPNPPMDAARLDVMHPRLWGRAEGVRSVVQTVAEGFAPTVFGVVSEYGFGGPGGRATTGVAATRAAGNGLELTFLVMLVALLAAGAFALVALRSYPRDVATADASVAATGVTAATATAVGNASGG